MSTPDVPSPKATRQARPKWLDPKLFLGILLVLASMALGAKIVGDATVTTQVYIAKEDIGVGVDVSLDMFDVASLRFTDQEDANRYIGADSDASKRTLESGDVRTLRGIKAGVLVPSSALTKNEDERLRKIPVPVKPGYYPADLKVGDLVDVYFVPKSSQNELIPEDVTAGPLWVENATVTAVPETEELTGSGALTLRVALESETHGDFDPSAFALRLALMDAVVYKHDAPPSLARAK